MTGHLAERLDAFVDGELDAATATEAASHVASCAVCQRQVESRRALSAAIQGALPRFTAPASLVSSLALTSPPTVARSGARRFWPGLAAAVALIGLAGVGGYGLGRQTGR